MLYTFQIPVTRTIHHSHRETNYQQLIYHRLQEHIQYEQRVQEYHNRINQYEYELASQTYERERELYEKSLRQYYRKTLLGQKELLQIPTLIKHEFNESLGRLIGDLTSLIKNDFNSQSISIKIDVKREPEETQIKMENCIGDNGSEISDLSMIERLRQNSEIIIDDSIKETGAECANEVEVEEVLGLNGFNFRVDQR